MVHLGCAGVEGSAGQRVVGGGVGAKEVGSLGHPVGAWKRLPTVGGGFSLLGAPSGTRHRSPHVPSLHLPLPLGSTLLPALGGSLVI